MAPEERVVGMYSEGGRTRTVEPLGALRTDTALGLGGESQRSAASSQNHGLRSPAAMWPAAGLTGEESLLTSALEYHVQVAGQPEAAIELWEVSDGVMHYHALQLDIRGSGSWI